ncbi:fungal-specific transcription factor domain-containing protein [Mycena maculata]|uniref:Fungal-specific transcription factor domain-containing protein n=1 Tax=Mycena maculata TaxID=230809 RepID=A0AAD7HE39_9AGAR|nr:fungal-specific transcription factor domain-containing protein [Mycena maculata]
MTDTIVADGPSELPSRVDLRNKDGSISKQRAHKGNAPTLPQTKACPHCSARFTRSTHLTRHLKTHTNERLHRCTTCSATFTRSDLLARHRKSCDDPSRARIRSCLFCTESKVKCDRNDPCSRCKTKGRDCVYAIPPRKRVPTALITAPSSVSFTSESSSMANTSSFPSTPDLPVPNTKPADNMTILPIDSLSAELAELTTETNNPHALVHSHLSSMYENDIFQPFFSDVFSTSAHSTLMDDSPPSFPYLPSLEELPLHSGRAQEPWFRELSIYPQNSYPQGEGEQRLLLNDFFTRELQAADPKHYLYLFFNAFLAQMPIVHSATFELEAKPPYLLKSMKSCGALFVKTRKASAYITEALTSAREGLALAFAQTMTDPADSLHLILSVVLLQTIGLFHQRPDERATSNLYHGMLVMMIRRLDLISKNSSWTPTTSSRETMWREWVFYETTKRALLLSYLHDCCQSIYFGLPPSYVAGEINSLRLPCAEALWKAQSAQEWFSVLQASPLNQSSTSLLTGLDYGTTLVSLVRVDPNFDPNSLRLSPFAHFILIHVILRDLFTTCTETIPLALNGPPRDDEDDQTMMAVQYALHHWLHSWRASRPDRQYSSEEPPFIENALPLYWLGQVAILARQEGLPPFDSPQNAMGEMRFKMVKRWLRRIRSFLIEGDGESTLFWDELMRIQLQTWRLEYDTDGGQDDQDGLLGFFPEL